MSQKKESQKDQSKNTKNPSPKTFESQDQNEHKDLKKAAGKANKDGQR